MAENDIYQLSLVQICNGREITNIFYYVETEPSFLPPNAVAREIIIGFFEGVWRFDWKPIVCNKTFLTAIWSARIWPTVGEPWVQPYVDEIGGLLVDSIPNGSCVLMSFNKSASNRAFKRRVYVSGVGEATVFESELTNTGLTNFRLLAKRIRELAITSAEDPAAEWKAAAFSKKLAAASDPRPWDRLSDWTVNPPIRSQRGRNLT